LIDNKDIKIFSFFAGAGFLDLGFEDSGYDIAYVNEYYKPFFDAYKFSRSNLNIPEPQYGYFNGDISELLIDKKKSLKPLINELRKQSKFIGFIGGPPCPDFSVGGKNKGKDGDNGRLSAIYVNLICEEKPDFFLFENVKGLWKTKIHREYFDMLKLLLQTNGYITTERLINALEYGAPQDRTRIVLMGYKKTFLKGLGYKLKTAQNELEFFPWEAGKKYSTNDIMSKPWPSKEPFRESETTNCPVGLPIELTVENWFNKNEVLNHTNSMDYFHPRDGLIKMQTVYEGDDSKKSYKRLHRWRYSPTAAYGNNEVHLHPYKARRISVSEALAIQSLPKNFCLPENMTLTDKFKTIGNGVAYLMGKGIAEQIGAFLGDISN
jgi:DNA (cytosine-5)-methyltransferase 1